jgi:hemerythrin superfamily protein
MVDFPKLELSKLDLPKLDLAGQWDRVSTDLTAHGRKLGRELANRGHDIAGDLAKRARRESRSFAKREQAFEDEVRSWLGSPAARVAGAAVLGFVVGIAASGARKAAVQGGEALAGDWLAVLKAEHRMVEKLFETILATGARQKARRAALFVKINYALTKHALQEETVVYPALRETQIDGMAKHLYADHADIKIHLHALADMAKDDPQFIERVRALQACVAHHVREEEDEVFPAFHDKMSPQQNAKLTLAVHREGLKLA